MRSFLNIFILMLIYYANNAFADIKSPNVGEQAMIENLRLAINQDTNLKNKKIIIGAGNSGCKAFQERHAVDEIRLLLTWQWLEEMEKLKPDTIIVAPKHAIDKNFHKMKKNIKLITIDGVLHSKNLSNIQKENSDLIDKGTEIIVMLGGDTEQQNGKWKLYNEKMANILIKKLPKNQNILILNGPRTGKHRIDNGAIVIDEAAHKTSTDYVTEFVLNNSKDNKFWKIEDFRFAEKSLWGPALKFCVNNPKVILALPGESTSMISESLSLGIRPVIYKHKAMTKTSKKYVNSLIKEGLAIL